MQHGLLTVASQSSLVQCAKALKTHHTSSVADVRRRMASQETSTDSSSYVASTFENAKLLTKANNEQTYATIHKTQKPSSTEGESDECSSSTNDNSDSKCDNMWRPW